MLPNFLREDKNFRAICNALNDEIKLLYEQTNLVKLYSNIDNLPEEILDELAWQFNSIEYNTSYSIAIKRELIKNCIITHHRRGTVASVEDVASRIFGNATVSEWFEYGGEPYHFKVHTETVTVSDDMINEFNRVIRQTQNIRSHLEEVITETINSMDVFFGGVMMVDEDILLHTKPLEELTFLNAELRIRNRQLYLEPVVIQEQNLVFADRSNGRNYKIAYDVALQTIGLESAPDSETAVDSLTLTDIEDIHTQYVVFVDNGRLYYEKSMN